MKQITDTPYIVKTKPGYASICTGIIGFIFFGLIALYLINTKWISNEDPQKTNFITSILTGTFLIFSFASLLLLLNLRILTLTETKLIISKPLLFYTKSISLTQIKSIRQSDDPVKVSRGFTTTTIYSGKKATIELLNGGKVKFNSLEVNGYEVLIRKINETVRYLRFNHSDANES